MQEEKKKMKKKKKHTTKINQPSDLATLLEFVLMHPRR